MYSFRSIKSGTDWSPRLLVYGDMGDINARSLAQMTLEVQQDRYDLVLHVGKSTLPYFLSDSYKTNILGDFAYDMNDVSCS